MANENGQTSAPALVPTQNAGENYALAIIPAYALQQAEILREYRNKLQKFTAALQTPPPPESLDAVPGSDTAKTVVISHVEMTLDEMFFGLWETYDFKWTVIANEVVGSLVLEVEHPVSGKKIRRTGAAAIQIMVDQTPPHLKDDKDDSYAVKQEKKRNRNNWANNPENKKPAALDMGFPRLKAECTKNAAQSLGKLFGRDLNRRIADTYQGLNGLAANKGAAATAATEQLLKPKT